MVRFPAFVVLAGFLVPVAGSAQTGPELRVIPRAGVLTPADWFYVEFPSFGSGPLEWTEAAIESTPVVGLAGELALDHLGIWIRGEVVRTLGGRTTVIHALLNPASQAGPGFVVRTPFDVPSSLTIGTIDIGLPTRLRLPGGVQPYVTAGVGGKRYAFDVAEVETRSERIVVPRGGVVPVVNAGVGATVVIRGWSLDLLVRDALSEYWGELQHDVMFLAGLNLRVR